jgi:hypothetical protein
MAQVVEWSSLAYGATAGPLLGAAVLWLRGQRNRAALGVAAVGAAAGTVLWNTMLNIRNATTIDGDIPFRLFPISWQDTGTTVFAFACATLALLATNHRKVPGEQTLRYAATISAAVLILDVYTW